MWGGSYGLRQGKTRFCVFDDSTVIFNGKACISKGSNVVVRQGATLSFGQDFFAMLIVIFLLIKKFLLAIVR